MQVRIVTVKQDRLPIMMGVIRLENGALVAEPTHTKLLQHIIQSSISVILNSKPRELRSHDEPELFLEYLHVAYDGPNLYATTLER